MLFALILKREDIETAKTRVVVQSLLEKEGIDKAWKEYLNIAYPWAETAKKRETSEWVQRLAEEVSRGPLAVFAQQDPMYRSRLKARVIERDKLSPEARATISKISKRLPPIVPQR